jgi:hypothetical protein
MHHMSWINAGVIAAVSSLAIAVGVIRSFLGASEPIKLVRFVGNIEVLIPAVLLPIVLAFVSVICSFRNRKGRLLIYTCVVLMGIIYVIMPAFRPPRG